MQEFESRIVPDKISITNQKEVNKEVKFLGKIRPHPGQKLWELNLKTGWIQEIVVDDVTVNLKGGVSKKFMVKENCMYTVAINIKNANRKFIKMTQRK